MAVAPPGPAQVQAKTPEPAKAAPPGTAVGK
jgi:hypothetical protein